MYFITQISIFKRNSDALVTLLWQLKFFTLFQFYNYQKHSSGA